MLPFTGLWFSCPKVERNFTDSLASGYVTRVDKIFRYTHLSMRCAHATLLVVTNGIKWTTLVTAALFAAALMYETLWRTLKVDVNPRRRTKLVVLMRLLWCPVTPFLWFMSRWIDPTITTSTSLLSFIVVHSGAFTLAVTALVLPLPMKHHLPVQLGSWCVMVLFVSPRSCSVFPEGGSEREAHLLSVWRAVRGLLIWGPACQGFTVDKQPPPFALCCRQLLVWIHTLFLCGPSYALWLLEYDRRCSFIQSIRTDVGRNRDWKRVKWNVFLGHICAVVIGLACSWLWMQAALF